MLDSTPLYDAVATMDTVTLIRSAPRGLLSVAGPLEERLRRRAPAATSTPPPPTHVAIEPDAEIITSMAVLRVSVAIAVHRLAQGSGRHRRTP